MIENHLSRSAIFVYNHGNHHNAKLKKMIFHHREQKIIKMDSIFQLMWCIKSIEWRYRSVCLIQFGKYRQFHHCSLLQMQLNHHRNTKCKTSDSPIFGACVEYIKMNKIIIKGDNVKMQINLFSDWLTYSMLLNQNSIHSVRTIKSSKYTKNDKIDRLLNSKSKWL